MMSYTRKIAEHLLLSVVLFLTFIGEGLCQKKGPLPVNASYTLQYSYQPGSGDVKGTYKVVKSGNATNDELISWNIVVLVGTDKREEVRTLTMEIRRGNGQQEEIFPLNMGEVILYTFKGDNIAPRPISLPSINDFNPTIRKDQGPILEGETVTLLVNPSKRFEQINWVWKNGKRGESIQQEVKRTTTYTVYGEYKGTSFRTKEKSVIVNVNRLADVLDFEIKGPTFPVADTNEVTLSLNIQTNLFQNDLQWVWKDHQNQVLSRNKTSIKVQPNPFIENGLVRVCPSAGDRQFACKSFQIPLLRLPSPSGFSIQYPAKLYTDQSATIKAESSNRNPETKWTWSINGRKINTTADSILIRPVPGMTINVYPTLNRRGGIVLQQQAKLTNVILKTALPTEINGQMRFCGVPPKAVTYQLESAILGSDSDYWLVMENNKEVTRFKGNSFSLLSKKSSSFYLTTDKRPDLKFPFSVEVVELPLGRISIDGPSQLCSGLPFTLTLNGLSEENKMKWQWYRTDASNSTYRKAMGSRASLRDSIQTSYTYSITAEYDGCPLPEKVFHQVTIFKGPSMPQPKYEFLNSTKDKIRLTVLNNTDPKSAYQWSKDQFRTVYAIGDIVSSYRLKKGPNNFYVRYTDDCDIQSPMASISVIGKKRGYLFINAGVNGTDFPRNISYDLTFGTKSWYLRGKASLPFVLKNQFQTSLGSTSLQISDQSRVTNYPRTSGTYYIVNGNATISRISATTGFLIGTPVIRFYLGGGFGKADILWGLDIHNYSGGSKEREVWAINSDQSTAGPEVESGVFIKIGSVNIMGGASMIKGSKIAKPYGEFQLGIGFNIK
jgi:hypothetical protein